MSVFSACGTITLTTDFGLKDSYVGTMKGVILRIFPGATLIDITHQITPQDLLEAALIVGSAYRYFPRGTVHLVIVDPGVGGDRRPLVVTGSEHAFVGPDNGIFSHLMEADPEARFREIRESRYLLPGISDTFHGRDLFAPIAAYLARGVDPAEFGPEIAEPIPLEAPNPRIWGDQVRGEVIHLDSFGNVVSNITRRQFEGAVQGRAFSIELNGKKVDRISRTYSDQERGRTLALFNSHDLLEIAVREGRADRRLGAGKGDTILIQIDDARTA